MRQLKSKTQKWPIAGSFRIAHGSVSEIEVVSVQINEGAHKGRGECRPYARYGETPKSVRAQIDTVKEIIESGGDQAELSGALPAGAARNAVDCALWDLQAKSSGIPAWQMLGVPQPKPRTTAFTLSIDSPTRMAKAALRARNYPVLKLKIDGFLGLNACLAVIEARRDAQFIIDANESLSSKELKVFRRELQNLPVLMIEQPLKASEFDRIDNTPEKLPILCADESLHTLDDLRVLWNAGYRAVNIKLDKCGGLTTGLELIITAKAMGFVIMAGCMVGTSLAMAPIMTLESYADVIDLDGPLLLAKDLRHGLVYEIAEIRPPKPKLWG